MSHHNGLEIQLGECLNMCNARATFHPILNQRLVRSREPEPADAPKTAKVRVMTIIRNIVLSFPLLRYALDG